MQLQNHLLLFRYFLSLVGESDFTPVRRRAAALHLHPPAGLKELFDRLLPNCPAVKGPLPEAYVQRLEKYSVRLRRHRGGENWSLKYFQALAALFCEWYLEAVFQRPEAFVEEINDFVERQCRGQEAAKYLFTINDLNKVAFWMATGSGKTLLMHINYWQMLRHSPRPWDNILLITPNEGLSRQHFSELCLSSIPARLYDGDPDHLYTAPGEILVIDIHKLRAEKSSGGVSVDVASFDGRNLVFIDEGHKGQKSEEQRWKRLREEIARNGFIFEYSATFGQVIGKNTFLLGEYARSILFDYSYHHFFRDGFGKNFRVHNLTAGRHSAPYADRVLTAALLGYSAQLRAYQANAQAARRLQIEKPLWVFAGSRVTGRQLDSDVLRVLRFLRQSVSGGTALTENLTALREFLQSQAAGMPLWPEELLKGIAFEEMIGSICGRCGTLELFELLQAPGEIGLKISGAAGYFGVINVGDVRELKLLLEAEDFAVQPDYLSHSLFEGINREGSPLNVLIGSRKFVEGWNSWRVSTMVLMNMGRGEGPQIVQLFGRGVRLKGENFSLRRACDADSAVDALQTLFIYGLNAAYINAFLSAIRRENVLEDEPDGILSETAQPQLPLEPPPSPSPRAAVELIYEAHIARQVIVDVRPRLRQSFSDGEPSGGDPAPAGGGDVLQEFPAALLPLIEFEALYQRCIRYKQSRGWHSLVVRREPLRLLLSDRQYQLRALPGQLRLSHYHDLPALQQVAESIAVAYLQRFYHARLAACAGTAG